MIKLIKGFGLALLLSGSIVGTANAGLMNVALDGEASQSSTGFGGVASRAIDGDTNGVYNDGSVTHTNSEQGAWWEVDLGRTFDIAEIVIWNRTDVCCTERLTPYLVRIFNAAHEQVALWGSSITPSPSQSVAFTPEVSGQFVQISLEEINFLQLAEVQVFAVPEPGSLALLGLGLAGLGFSRRKIKA